MRISPTTNLSEPSGAEKISEGTLTYFRARNRRRLYEFVVKEFERSGLSQAHLARRLGKGTDIVCRWLGSPGNWTADTVSDLLFASSGAEAGYIARYPLQSVRVTSTEQNAAASNITAVNGVVQTSTEQPYKSAKGALVGVSEDRANVLNFETYRRPEAA
jgi:hypothetical protein